MDAALHRFPLRAGLGLALAGLLVPRFAAASNKNNPTSKFYVADVDGTAEIDTGEKVDDLTKQSVYNAEGTVVETQANATNAMVFSNGTGVFFDQDTRLEVKRFQQEPFLPNRTDMDTEPSVSLTQAVVPHGTVALCTSKLVAGSTMNYSTPLGSVNIQGGKVVISSSNNQTVISNLEGEATVNAGNVDTGGQPLRNGQQAVITPGQNGAPPQVTIQSIPSSQSSALSNEITMACNAKKTVYFAATTSTTPDVVAPTRGGSAATADAATSSVPGTVTAFDGDNAGTGAAASSSGGTSATATQTIVAIPVAPSTAPLQYSVSPASLTTAPSSP